MEFRQVVSVCRSAAAAATRPSLASTRPFPSSVLIQRHQFSTNNKQQSEAAAAAAAVQQPPSETPVNPRSPAYRVAQLQASLSQNPSSSSSLPPRPPIRKNNMLEGSQKSWAAPQARSGGGNSSSGGASLFRNTTLTGRAPTSSSSSSSSSAGTGDLFNLPTQITSDMERATGAGGSKSDGSTGTTGTTETMSTWSEDEFLPKHYDVSEPELRLRPSTGRTIQIKGNVDLARGFRLLHRAVSQNKIKAHVRLTRFHERPALKRKRLKRERWQERFRQGFRATINRVMELKAQGW
ncbi:hypothetical protein MYCTH_2310836 [Thermothelomyces thermophilus ATCC 42464]|uniref:Ribosomal protein S21 n=1 Tax=Thermothelomyces thermophilus (strain ATCC 42464 / BCRC 31852 / DSM 1799) TaxID=573729 RepID=G2QM71_THET4|nr:uncharacterized protein MYCTH_2310836 [Thermothelomyces thermophilus ATCC 42464]AEO61051.1 hypothetical protein MYCTH_2310836 [Thermothelomyces thermophilus ATCC 42464]